MHNYLQLREFEKYSASAWALIAANALPLLGVLFLGWDTFSIVALYWVENVIIGAINVLKMITCRPGPEFLDWSKLTDAAHSEEARQQYEKWRKQGGSVQLVHNASKLFLVPFFFVHYGLFCLVHGIFVFVLFGPGTLGLDPFDQLFNIDEVFRSEHLWWGVLALAASHLWSFFVNFLGHGEYRRTVVPLLMFQPYARVVVLHLAILLGAFFAFALGSNAVVLIVLIVGKTILDLSLHLREHLRIEQSSEREPSPILPEVIMGETNPTAPTPAASQQSHPPAHSSSGD
jgi:hypothetical protein